MKMIWQCLSIFLLIFVSASAFAQEPSKVDPPSPEADKKLDPVFTKIAPESLDEMKIIESNVKELVKKCSKAVVGLKFIGSNSEGSGVIISEDGYILTAAHVSGMPNKDLLVLMPDGQKYKAKSLGRNNTIDAGLVKIVEEGKFPYVPIGRSSKVNRGDWIMVLGHPNGYKAGRPPVLRVGRVLNISKELIQTDGALVGGDSGGPLFDMQGRVIGIHSKIDMKITDNLHVPVDTYIETWDRLVAAENWGGNPFAGNRPRLPYFGARLQIEENQVKIIELDPGSPAEKGGLKKGDIITRFDNVKVASLEEFNRQLRRRLADEEVSLEIQRGNETLFMKITLGKVRR